MVQDNRLSPSIKPDESVKLRSNAQKALIFVPLSTAQLTLARVTLGVRLKRRLSLLLTLRIGGGLSSP